MEHGYDLKTWGKILLWVFLLGIGLVTCVVFAGVLQPIPY